MPRYLFNHPPVALTVFNSDQKISDLECNVSNLENGTPTIIFPVLNIGDKFSGSHKICFVIGDKFDCLPKIF